MQLPEGGEGWLTEITEDGIRVTTKEERDMVQREAFELPWEAEDGGDEVWLTLRKQKPTTR